MKNPKTILIAIIIAVIVIVVSVIFIPSILQQKTIVYFLYTK